MLGHTLMGLAMLFVAGHLVNMGVRLSKAGGDASLGGMAMICWGVVMAYIGIGYASSGVSYDVQRIRYYSGPINCSDITIYTLRGCPWCTKAMAEMKAHGLAYTEVEYTRDMPKPPPSMPDGTIPDRFPQIWVKGRNMGGFGEMPNWIDNCQ
jgi:glutaredoxin